MQFNDFIQTNSNKHQAYGRVEAGKSKNHESSPTQANKSKEGDRKSHEGKVQEHKIKRKKITGRNTRKF